MPNFEDETRVSGAQFRLDGDVSGHKAGEILGGKYKIVALLGKGGMGTVYQVQQVFLNVDLALKILDGKQHLNESQMRRFRQEAKAAYSLNHPGLVKVHDFGLLDNEQPYLVMDLIRGKTLSEYIKEFGPMPLHEACEVFIQAANSLYYAHQQSVIHRDIKPSNIMLLEGATSGTPGSVAIVDFGIAKVVGEEIGEMQALTRTGEVFGSPLYMSPEQCSGESVDHRSDIYSLGCALFETLTGAPPHIGANALRTMMLHQTSPAPLLKDASLGLDFPASIEQILKKMLEKAPQNRYQNLEDVARDLAEVSVNVGPKGPFEQSKINQERNRENKKNTDQAQKNRPHESRKKLKLIGAVSLAITGFAITTIAVFNNFEKSNLQNSAKTYSNTAALSRTNIQDSGSSIIDGANSYNQKDYENVTRSREDFAAADRIKAVVIREGSKKVRQINFPKSAIGAYEYEHNENHLEARGTVTVPATGHLQLIVGERFPASFYSPTVLKKIEPDIFRGLAVTAPSMQMDAKTTPLENEKANSDNTADVLWIASNWTNLREVVISCLVINRSTIKALASFKHLDDLQVYKVKGSEIELANQPFLRKLKLLKLNNAAATDILKTVSGSKALTHLYLESNNLTAADCENIAHCQNIEELCLGGNKLTDAMLEEIEKMKSLRQLTIADVPMVSRQVRELLKIPGLQYLILVGTAHNCLDANPVEDSRLKVLDRHQSSILKDFE